MSSRPSRRRTRDEAFTTPAAYQKRRDFEQTIHDMAEETQVPFRERIIGMDPNRDSPTFDGGFDSVVRLYRSHLLQDIAEAALVPGSEVSSIPSDRGASQPRGRGISHRHLH
mmetsp:Transcript_12716/g.23098  ORF Transcript_12716/g.23098 Transcript_12716/m.23098 type:complete len:112 (+) Transcript_12716:1074-1409(+)